jgi:hypothetical protein
VNSTGKAARKRHGTRYAAKAAKPKKRTREYGKLPVSAARGNAISFDSEAIMQKAAKDHEWVRAGLGRPRGTTFQPAAL